MAIRKKETDSGCCGECCHGCGICGWFFLIWGLLFLAYGLGYFQSVDFLKTVSAWTIFGLGVALAGLLAIIHPMICK